MAPGNSALTSGLGSVLRRACVHSTAVLTLMQLFLLAFGFAILLTGCDKHQVATGKPDYIPIHHCQANLKQIDGAKALWAQDHHKTTNDIPVWSDLVGRDRYLGSQPACPEGGTYNLGRVGERATCPVAGHTL